MTPFARLLCALVFTASRNAKLRVLRRYFEATPDPDRGWALAALCGKLDLRSVKPAVIRALVEERVDPVLFRLSYDFVGDLAETVALIWPDTGAKGAPLLLSEAVDALRAAGRQEAPALLARMLDRLPADERFALIKLATGGMRVGVSERLAKTALAQMSADVSLEDIEALWHGLEPPYVPLFAWLEGRAGAPSVDLALAFRPMMLAHPIEAALYSAGEQRENTQGEALTLARMAERLSPADFIAEWKWDGIRVQAIATPSGQRLYSRTGEEIGGAFPDLLAAMRWRGAVDGELLVMRDGEPAPFADLQKRLGRKAVSARMLREFPAHIRAYDLLHDGERDLRDLPLAERQARLQDWLARETPVRLDLSPPVPFESWEGLGQIRAGARAAAQEGLMLKRRDAPYVGGRPMGPWFKWKRDPLSADCVLMYAQRGHGKRSSFYSDYTFGAWTLGEDGPRLTPVGKAYSGYTDDELKELDRWIRAHTTDRFGPVRAVEPALVFEVAFDAVQRSSRHKSGIAMRFPRIKRIRWDKPAHEADRLDTLEAMIAQ
ncbi:MAG: cisplatin damage response ATP-dependent DNA ligase [Neomegalonema sp.]|nr:cisplatin damage response ATP-dependent DNA ligase [Neomegalonema sp.]